MPGQYRINYRRILACCHATQHIYIAYGLGEGEWQGRKLRNLLAQNGHSLSRTASAADVIIAHSGALFLLPRPLRANHVVIVNPGFRCSVAYPILFARKIWRDFLDCRRHRKTIWFFGKTAVNIFYALVKLPDTLRMAYGYWFTPLSDALPKCQISLIRTSNDPWPPINHVLITRHNITVYDLPGEHDDLWFNPENFLSYVN